MTFRYKRYALWNNPWALVAADDRHRDCASLRSASIYLIMRIKSRFRDVLRLNARDGWIVTPRGMNRDRTEQRRLHWTAGFAPHNHRDGTGENGLQCLLDDLLKIFGRSVVSLSSTSAPASSSSLSASAFCTLMPGLIMVPYASPMMRAINSSFSRGTWVAQHLLGNVVPRPSGSHWLSCPARACHCEGGAPTKQLAPVEITAPAGLRK